MKASLHWLRSLLPGLPDDASAVAERLTAGGLEVEAVSRFGGGLDAVLVAAVSACEPLPGRAGLQVVSVDCGAAGTRSVVCGAPNVPPPGGLVCLAPIGTTLPAARVTVASRAFDGVRSEGMLCSEAELGVGEDAAGLLVLPPGAATPGTPLYAAFPSLPDAVFEIGVTPNRPDALGHVGIARDLGALFGLPFRPPAPDAPVRVADIEIEQLVEVEVRDFERCPHYGALVVVDTEIAPSPPWLRMRLTSLGVRPVSNVVDITNLILLEYGHPMHAFDLDLVRGGRIVVRRAEPGEAMVTLDGVQRRLDADDLLICDGAGPVALGGVMGGENTEIRPSTRRVLFECAYFEPRGIRRTSRRHGLRSESSHRFERGVDRLDAADVLAQAGSLATRLAGAKAVRGAIHAQAEPPAPRQVALRGRKMDELLGVHVPLEEARDTLARLGFGVQDGSDLAVTVPSFRPDVAREADLVEEVARVRGLDSIPTVLPPIKPQPPRATHALEGAVRRAAVELGLSEAVTYGFVSARDLERVGAPAPVVRVANPLANERDVMRTSLLPGLFEAVARARRRGERTARLFGVGAVFLEGTGEGPLPEERPSFAALVAGRRDVYLDRPEDVDVYDAKGLATEMVARVARRDDVRVEPFDPAATPRHLHPRGAASLMVDGVVVGRFGLVHPDVADAFDVGRAAFAVEIDLDALGSVGRAGVKLRPVPRVPASTRDVALVVAEQVAAGEVGEGIRQAAGDLCESVELFDVFAGEGVEAGHRSLAFHVVYRDPRAGDDPDAARTLTDAEVDARHAAVVAAARERFGARLRG
jgi:phenylalanyl-tRNA synthetase beta chain